MPHRPLAASALAAALALAGCSSTAPAGSGAGATPPRRAVLVDASGATPDVEAFVSRLSLEATEAERISIVDARLAGARAAELAADPEGDRSRAFRQAWPGDAFLSVSVSPCFVASRSASESVVDPSTGIRSERIRVSYTAECSVGLALHAAGDGKPILSAVVKGTATMRPSSEDEEVSAETEALQDAARKGAKKLASALGR